MISADQITLHNDGDRAWLLYRPGVDPMVRWKQANRPCDTCEGTGRVMGNDGIVACPDCDGTGRHTFDITLAILTDDESTYGTPSGTRTLRVHVVQVLPILGGEGRPAKAIRLDFLGHDAALIDGVHDPVVVGIDLPPARKVGMWAVELAVHKEET